MPSCDVLRYNEQVVVCAGGAEVYAVLRTPFAQSHQGLPTVGHPTPDAVGGGAKGTGRSSVPSFVVSTFSR